MSLTPAGILTIALDFLRLYVVSNIITLIIALLVVSFGVWVVNRRRDFLLRAALRAEIMTNSGVSKTLVDYTQNQLGADVTVQPMPQYYDTAYNEYKRAGLLLQLRQRTIQELADLYLYQESVNEAGRRQEDLAYGPSSAFPNAHSLRLQNLQYISDTVHNVVIPYFDRLRDIQL
jgi:hypothetical protein